MHDIILHITRALSPYIGNPVILELTVSAVLAAALSLIIVIIGRFIDIIGYGMIFTISRLFGDGLALFIGDYITFPGVVIHELSHALFVFITGGRVDRICLITPADDRRLGYVEFTPRGNMFQVGLQMALGSCAPVITGLILEYLIFTNILAYPVMIKGVFLYIAVSVLCHMSMSREDMINYFKGIFLIFPIILGLVCMARWIWQI